MRQDLKAYVLIDSRNRFVPGSLILRKPNQRPARHHNGKWVELTPYLCCVAGEAGTPQTLTPPTLTAPNTFTVTVTSGGLTETVNTGTTTVSALATYMTTNYGDVGTFVADGTTIIFTPSVDGATVTFGQALNGVNVALPALDGGNPNYIISFTNGPLSIVGVDSNTTTGAALVAYLTANYAALGTYTLNGTNVLYKAAAGASGTILGLTAGA